MGKLSESQRRKVILAQQKLEEAMALLNDADAASDTLEALDVAHNQLDELAGNY